ncbi:tripartite tricarboxylate transporter substrate binding protein [Pseudoroseomonas cervicalis]|uniref:tripartite tricarboxylate transporter substrate binding protein n=1 Tax=Teichococcus cervicalis TaxID=204525 RepID=UPI0027892A06|nr:tripartite tricarboxylate transporter substrate binding protein [Pseudoroseomonas cervicalis]MDQ1081876.1 tripartite-type tricarboxylate transporter receptor subunit TctC [Pseudoroseomonas cervicalis]
MQRRQLLAAAAAPLFLPRLARAQAWPSQPIRLLVPFSAGGPTDLPARLVADELSRSLGQRVVVENRTGSGVIVASDAVAKAPKDGYTLLYTTVGHAVARALFPHLPFDPIADFQPVAHIGRIHNVVMVNRDVPAQTLPELLALFRNNPGKYNYASNGNGGSIHLATELLLSMAGGLEVTHVAYRGSTAAMPDLLSGQVAMMLDVISSGMPFIQKGETRGLAITAAQRSPLYPDLPTVAETVPGYESFTWHMVLAPAGTPPEIVRRLNTAINAVVADPRHNRTLQSQGMDVVTDSTPESSGAFLRAEIAKWEAVIQRAGIKAS